MTTKKLTNADEPNWGLFYREHAKDLTARKSIKIKLPIRQHIKLHAMKLFTENNISETVERALDDYFQKLKAEEGDVGVYALAGPAAGPFPPEAP
ncbi:MAG TPA: hypothetical protein VI997_11685 [Candidatus Thermoplasmatota archaeon]|nr:hypothetical protein [Candidatus Thermoplasmatota archaeon]